MDVVRQKAKGKKKIKKNNNKRRSGEGKALKGDALTGGCVRSESAEVRRAY